MVKVFKYIVFLVLILALSIAALLVYWYLRPNDAQVNSQIVLDSWSITEGDRHNSNTDMISWRDQFYIAYVSSPYHFSSNASVLNIKRSDNKGVSWQDVKQFNPDRDDIRDPKLAVIGNRLFIYALKNRAFNPNPYISVYAYSDDGVNWTGLKEVPDMEGWLLWRPKTRDGVTFYNSAYWWQHGKACLLVSTNGINWKIISTINEGERNDETEIEFLPNGDMIATARLEYGESFPGGSLGDSRGSTLIATSTEPYTSWTETAQSRVTRLDGPVLFSYRGQVYALGRYQPEPGSWGRLTAQGSSMTRKRTSLFALHQAGLAYLTDLPSGGDTSYAGLVLDGDIAYVSYYTNSLDHDYGWIMGMYAATNVRIAKLDLLAMEALARKTPAK